MTLPVDQGPPYPDLGAGVAKWRKVANKAGSIAAMARADVVAYADAIEKAIRAKHRTMHARPTPSLAPRWHTPPPISRLFKYDRPHPMVGDPKWNACKCAVSPFGLASTCKCDHWGMREKAVYAAAMESKRAALQINVAA